MFDELSIFLGFGTLTFVVLLSLGFDRTCASFSFGIGPLAGGLVYSDILC